MDTSISFTEETNPNGEHIIKIPSLGAKEYVNIQLLSHAQLPILLNIRSADGPAKLIHVHLQRIFPRWFNVSAAGLLLLGFGFTLYWVIRSVVYLSQAIGIF